MKQLSDYPCTLVEAPMGYGKTTAVRECLKNTNAYVLWQTIFDGSTKCFWTGFCGLLREFDVECSLSLEQLGFPDDSVSRQEALRIISAIDFPKRTVLVIDDYHVVECAELNDLIEFLVRNETPDFSIVLTLRYTSLQNLDELKLKGYLNHVTKQNFEFDTKEIKAYYKVCGISLTDSEADKLYALTEGWISALYLMMLNFMNEGNFGDTRNIYMLVEKAIYIQLSDEIKEFLQTICLFDNFSLGQAVHMWQKENSEKLLAEIISMNTLIKFDDRTRTYQIHNIFTKLLMEKFESRPKIDKKHIYEKAAHWYMKSGDYYTAMRYFHISEDFDSLMSVVEHDKGHCFYNDSKAVFIQYFEECPDQIRNRHPIAQLIYAINLFMFNEIDLFEKACRDFSISIQNNDCLDSECLNTLLGEFELLQTITAYNDIANMLDHVRKADALLKQPDTFIDTKEAWTFGSPSVLYMFYRETGKLETEVLTLKEALPCYSKLTNGHGKGGEYVMEAEWYFNRGDIQNAEIIAHKAMYEANRFEQYDITICATFLQARIALFKGDYPFIHNITHDLHEQLAQKRQYAFIHTIDLCFAFIYGGLRMNQKIPHWIENGDFESSRLFFPAMAFMNIVYGRALLAGGEYTKLLGIAEQFIGISSVFPNLLGHIYTSVYMAAANEQLFRRKDALTALRQALDIAAPDKVYMPFVENCDYIKPLLELLFNKNLYCEDISRILELYNYYQKSVEQIRRELFAENAPILAVRELEVSRLAAAGFSNKEIGERLFITQNTVKTVLKRVFEKLAINTRVLLKQYFDEHA